MTPEQQKLAEKEAKNLEKQTMAEEKHAAKLAGIAEKKEFKDRKVQAGKIALQLSQPSKALQGCLVDPNIQRVPVFTVEVAKASLVEIQDMFEECSAKKGEKKLAPISVDLAAVTEMCKKAALGSKDVNDFIAVIVNQRSSCAE